MLTVTERFLKYVSINTESDPNSDTIPSSSCQKKLAEIIKKELIELNLSNVSLDEFGYVYATLPGNSNNSKYTIGFIAHMDTSPDLSGFNVNPKFVENYDGSEIELNPNVFLKPSEFPSLKNYIGETLITTDGTTLLGADDKAGIAEIITAISYLVEHPEIERPTIKIAFTPDEEIGRGANKFDVPFFNADFAYTIDGGEIGELEYENFNAAGCKILVDGLNVHPGSAKNTMINAIEIGLEFHSLLPEFQKPQYTENDEGFFHLVDFSGSVEDASLSYIIRDHNINKFEDKKKLIETSAKFINDKYGRKIISFEIIDQYKNMKEKILPFMHIIDTAKDVMDELSIPVQIKAIRGGTDGARLSYMGLPCPNIFTGGHNFHGRYEYIPVSSMEKAVEVIIGISKKYA